MKRASNLYAQITDLNNILNMYEKMKSHVKNKHKLEIFEEFYTYNIMNIKNVLVNKNYTFIKYNVFLIRQPKYRIVMSQDISDKLINHLVAKYFLSSVLDKSLIDENVATRKDMGTSYGIKLLKKYLVQVINKNESVYALKFDIHKFFYSIDHQVLMDLVRKKIKDVDALNLLKIIINSTDQEYVNRIIENIKRKEIEILKASSLNEKDREYRINEVLKIPLYESGKGLPIGNMTSQILAIFYLNDLDHFIKEKLHCKQYIRYMDDGVILSSDKDFLKKTLLEITKFLQAYKLKLNDKTMILNVSKNGLEFLGFRYYIHNRKIIMKIRKDTKKRFVRKMKNKPEKAIIESYKGFFKQGNCHNLFYKILG